MNDCMQLVNSNTMGSNHQGKNNEMVWESSRTSRGDPWKKTLEIKQKNTKIKENQRLRRIQLMKDI